jgi:hypothetical protein
VNETEQSDVRKWEGYTGQKTGSFYLTRSSKGGKAQEGPGIAMKDRGSVPFEVFGG